MARSSTQFDNYVGLILNIQNIQMEMMQILQTVQAGVLQVQREMTELTSRQLYQESRENISRRKSSIYIEQKSEEKVRREPITFAPKNFQKIYGDRTTIKLSFNEENITNILKSESVDTLIRSELSKYEMFRSCTEQELDDVISIFQLEKVPNGTMISTQEGGDRFYVLEEGAFDLFDEEVHIGVLKSPASAWGMKFLSSSQSSSIKARGTCRIWNMLQHDFWNIILYHRKKALSKKVEYLSKIVIDNNKLTTLDTFDIQALALVTKEQCFANDEVIVREGESFDKLFMIESGTVDVVLGVNSCTKTLLPKDSFGENQFLMGKASQATYRASSTVKLYHINKEDFITTIGNFENAVKRLSYNEYIGHGIERDMNEKKFIEKISRLNLDEFKVVKKLDGGYFTNSQIVEIKKNVGFEFALKDKFILKNIGDRSLQKNLVKEKEILQKFHHPFILQIYSEIKSGPNTFYLMEPLSGRLLYDLINDNSFLSEDSSRIFSACVVLALGELHHKKVAHRDLKAENLALDENGFLTLIDFSISKSIEDGKSWTFVGTPEYLSPEILLCVGHDWAVDYWALGVLLFEMVSGITPFASDTPFKIFENILKNQVQYPTHFSVELVEIISKLLETYQSKRLGRKQGGITKIINHSWYSNLDWRSIYEKNGNCVTQMEETKEEWQPTDNASFTDELFSSILDTMGNRFSREDVTGSRYSQELTIINNDLTRSILGRSTLINMQRVIEGKTSKRLLLDESPALLRERLVSSQTSGMKEVAEYTKNQQLSQSNKSTSTIKTAFAFSTFILMSVDLNNLTDIISDWGNSELAPIVFNKTEILDEYPADSNVKNSEGEEALTLFCFPEGVRLRIIPRCAVEGAKRLGWLGSKADSFQLHVFHDEYSNESFGISITVKEEVTLPDPALLKKYRKQRYAASKICKCIKARHVQRGKEKKNVFTEFLDNLNKSKSGHFRTSTAQTLPNVSLRGAAMSAETGGIVISNSLYHAPGPSTVARRLAKESYEYMVKNDEEGEVFILEKCYTILGTVPENNSTLFCALQQLVDFERNSSDDVERRHDILDAIRTQIGSVSLVETLKKTASSVRLSSKKTLHEIKLRDYLPSIRFSLPPPLFNQEWGVFRLILRIKLRSLLVALQLLMIERSILIIGDNYEEVTSCVKALVILLAPYTWVSAFIPLLPTEMLAFVTSPVPFIVGVVAKSEYHRVSIETNQYVKQEKLNGLSIINLITGKLILTKEPLIKTKIRKYFDFTNEKLNRNSRLDYFQERVEYLASFPDSSLQSFRTFFQTGLSDAEDTTLNSIKLTLFEYLKSLSGVLSQHGDGWKQYGITLDETKEIFFSAEKVLLYLENEYEYLRLFTNTQLLANYFEEKKRVENNIEIEQKEKSLFIANWLSFRWWKYQRERWQSYVL